MTVVVLDNTRRADAIIGPETEMYVFGSEEEAKEEFPGAIWQRHVPMGSPLELPVMFELENE